MTAQLSLNFLHSKRDELSASRDVVRISDVPLETNLPDLTGTPTVLLILLGFDLHTYKIHINLSPFYENSKLELNLIKPIQLNLKGTLLNNCLYSIYVKPPTSRILSPRSHILIQFLYWAAIIHNIHKQPSRYLSM